MLGNLNQAYRNCVRFNLFKSGTNSDTDTDTIPISRHGIHGRMFRLNLVPYIFMELCLLRELPIKNTRMQGIRLE
jgi:hypothetical protein